jgi:hypothetical protein
LARRAVARRAERCGTTGNLAGVGLRGLRYPGRQRINRSAAPTAGKSQNVSVGIRPALRERTMNMLSPAVLAIAGTGIGLIGLLVIILLIILVLRIV